jgi:hypothetical protein
LTRPHRSACSAGTGSPKIAISLARTRLVNFVRIHAPPPSKGSPRRTKTSQNCARSWASTRSQASASWHPPPAAMPLTADRNGFSLLQMPFINRDQP